LFCYRVVHFNTEKSGKEVTSVTRDGVTPILGIDDLAFLIHAEAFRECFSASALQFAEFKIGRFARELAFGLRRRRRQYGFWCTSSAASCDIAAFRAQSA
jgi:hypothetical protein